MRTAIGSNARRLTLSMHSPRRTCMAVATHKTVEPTPAPVNALLLPHPNAHPEVAALLKRALRNSGPGTGDRYRTPPRKAGLARRPRGRAFEWRRLAHCPGDCAAARGNRTPRGRSPSPSGGAGTAECTRGTRPEAATAIYNDALSRGLCTELRALYTALEPLQARYDRLRELDSRLMSIGSGGPRGIVDESLSHRLGRIRDYLDKFSPEP